MLVKDIMVQSVVTAPRKTTAVEAAKIMSEKGIGSLLIVEDEKLAGLVTDRDILTKVVAKGKDIHQTSVDEIMAKEVIYVKPDLDVEDAANVMIENGIKKLPVIENETLVGIVTATDIIAAQPKIMDEIGAMVLLSKRSKPIAG
ncbi:MAG: CBS domain-containing protein [Candidatus Micrarchaeota archaeon]|nr:CBS domain-containing protein [Candidatus Micrarchaeota archaeon]